MIGANHIYSHAESQDSEKSAIEKLQQLQRDHPQASQPHRRFFDILDPDALPAFSRKARKAIFFIITEVNELPPKKNLSHAAFADNALCGEYIPKDAFHRSSGPPSSPPAESEPRSSSGGLRHPSQQSLPPRRELFPITPRAAPDASGHYQNSSRPPFRLPLPSLMSADASHSSGPAIPPNQSPSQTKFHHPSNFNGPHHVAPNQNQKHSWSPPAHHQRRSLQSHFGQAGKFENRMDQSLHLHISHFRKLATMCQAPASLYASALFCTLAANFQRNALIDFPASLMNYEALASSLCQSFYTPDALAMHMRSWDSNSVSLSFDDPLKDFFSSMVNLTISHADHSARFVINDAQLRDKMCALILASKWASSVVARPPEGSATSFRHSLRLCLAHHLETSKSHLDAPGASYKSSSNLPQDPPADAEAPISMVDEFCEFLQSNGLLLMQLINAGSF